MPLQIRTASTPGPPMLRGPRTPFGREASFNWLCNSVKIIPPNRHRSSLSPKYSIPTSTMTGESAWTSCKNNGVQFMMFGQF